jgi:hypothetical protein
VSVVGPEKIELPSRNTDVYKENFINRVLFRYV